MTDHPNCEIWAACYKCKSVWETGVMKAVIIENWDSGYPKSPVYFCPNCTPVYDKIEIRSENEKDIVYYRTNVQIREDGTEVKSNANET